jgi:glycerophosphoryl diester phosphodiesterase
VQYWTINDEDSVRKLVEIGADGIMTDHPNIVKKVLDQEYGKAQ